MHEFFLALPVLLFSMVAHEYAHGYAALKQGDRTALEMGRLTFNPVKHVDIWFTFLMPAMLFMASGGRVLFGGAKPVPVNPHNYRNYRRGDLIVSSAGIVTNVILVPVFLAAVVSVGMVAQGAAGGSAVLATIQRMFFWGVWLNLLLAFFNLIPIPPLDGSRLLYHVLQCSCLGEGDLVYTPNVEGLHSVRGFAVEQHCLACTDSEVCAAGYLGSVNAHHRVDGQSQCVVACAQLSV